MSEYISAISKCMVDPTCVTRVFYPANSLMHSEKNVNKTNNNEIIYGGDGTSASSKMQTGGIFNDLGVPALLVLVTKEECGNFEPNKEDDHYLSDEMFDQMIQKVQMTPKMKPTYASSRRAKTTFKTKGRTRKNKSASV